jgi:hypothetical protein
MGGIVRDNRCFQTGDPFFQEPDLLFFHVDGAEDKIHLITEGLQIFHALNHDVGDSLGQGPVNFPAPLHRRGVWLAGRTRRGGAIATVSNQGC